jgi:predicted amidohydrolase
MSAGDKWIMGKLENLNVAVVQTSSGADPVANLANLLALLEPESVRNADLVVVPEYALCCGSAQTIRSAARTVQDWRGFIADLVSRLNGVLVMGGLPISRAAGGVADSSLVVDCGTGEVVEVYDKMHLFKYAGGTNGGVDESDVFVRGDRVCTVDIRGWSVRLSICFDLRFPELFRWDAGYDVAVCTAAFTHETGLAHWETLLRARAIENQCFMVAAGLSGINPETGMNFYGHSCVIDPWGRISWAATGGFMGVRVETLEHSQICETRKILPALSSRV